MLTVGKTPPALQLLLLLRVSFGNVLIYCIIQFLIEFILVFIKSMYRVVPCFAATVLRRLVDTKQQDDSLPTGDRGQPLSTQKSLFLMFTDKSNQIEQKVTYLREDELG